MKDDPDIIRWSTLKSFGKHFLGWFIFYGVAGWLFDVMEYADRSNLSIFLMLSALSFFMAFVTWEKK